MSSLAIRAKYKHFKTICEQLLTILQLTQVPLSGNDAHPSKDLILTLCNCSVFLLAEYATPPSSEKLRTTQTHLQERPDFFFLKQRKTTLMRRWKTNEKRNDDVEIGNSKTFLFDGWDNAVTSTLDIAIFEKWCCLKTYETWLVSITTTHEKPITTSRPTNSEKWTSNKASKIGQGREHVRGLPSNKACVGYEHRIGNVRLITLWKVFDMNLSHSWHAEKKRVRETTFVFWCDGHFFQFRPNMVSTAQVWHATSASSPQSTTEAQAPGPQGSAPSNKNSSENKIMTDCFNSPGIHPFQATRKNSFPHRSRKKLKHGTSQNL